MTIALTLAPPPLDCRRVSVITPAPTRKRRKDATVAELNVCRALLIDHVSLNAYYG